VNALCQHTLPQDDTHVFRKFAKPRDLNEVARNGVNAHTGPDDSELAPRKI